MADKEFATIDGNEAAASAAFRLNEVIAIYPITPSSAMGEFSDQWAAEHQKNIWGTVPLVVEMQSEGGAAGAVHGALQTGALTTTFTASQGLLLMIPNMFKIAGELTATVFHVAARTVATHGLSIFGDHSDVMSVRATGWAMLSSANVQEAHDFAAIAQMATLEARLPFLHFFDGFRTSHEVQKIKLLSDDQLRTLIDTGAVRQHRTRGLTPERPVLRGTAQNPDVFFQAREASNPYYHVMPAIVQNAMDKFADVTGRRYRLYEYLGAPDAERVIVMMGSGAEAAQELLEYYAAREPGQKLGLLKVRLYRPFAGDLFMAALPATVKAIAVLDRTKEPGATGEPLYQDVLTALAEHGARPRVIGGRYGLSSKEFTPAMVKAVYDELAAEVPRNHFTVGIRDDVMHTSLTYDPRFETEAEETVRCVFYGLGADGTVGANKNSIKIIGEETDLNAQGYFVYDSKKSGSITISHLRFGPKPIHSTYLISSANFVACHQFNFLEKIDVLKEAKPGATFLLNSPYGPERVWDALPRTAQEHILNKKLRLFVIDAYKVARETGMGGRINTIMQTCFFAISGVLPKDEAIAAIKHAIEKTYGKRSEAVVRKNFEAVDQTLANLYEVKIGQTLTATRDIRQAVADVAPEFVRDVLGRMIAGQGDALPVSALPADGTFPTATTQWEKRGIAQEAPVWDPAVCIQCGKCVLVCPHAVIREKVVPKTALAGAPDTFLTATPKWKEFADQAYTLQISVEDCTGCSLCVEVCPAKNKSAARLKAINMVPVNYGGTPSTNGAQPAEIEAETNAPPSLPSAVDVQVARRNWDFFVSLPEVDREGLNLSTVKDTQLLQPLFEFSGACAGCGETPYVKLVSQLFGDRALIANATGCSSIYGGNLPTTPWAQNKDGRGPAWANSLFEDNAEFGLGFRLTLDKHEEFARELLTLLKGKLPEALVKGLLESDQGSERGIREQRGRVAELKQRLTQLALDQADPALAQPIGDLLSIADVLAKRSIWIIGGDGWAYDIGYGGLDHVLASGRNINVLVLDTEVYSNTGGQASKATPRGAVAKFASSGKGRPKKDLGLLAISYGDIYVARIAMGANDAQTVKALTEAESYPGVSLVIAYSHCIAHGYDLKFGLEQQKNAVLTGYWPIFRYDPRLAGSGKSPMQLDCKPPSLSLDKYMYNETRFRMLTQTDEARAEMLYKQAQADVAEHWKRYEDLAKA
jgi:pyruvate-ferredoxin/flavodoxin oxidoreductase